MMIPELLQLELSNAKSLINQEGELPAQVRGRILNLIETLSSPEHVNAGYLRRARLAILCANEVLSDIRTQPTVLESAKALLANGLLALSGKFDLKVLEQENGKHHTRAINLMQIGDAAFVAMYAAMASFAAINTVLYDTNFDLAGQSEKDVPPDDWDASFYASLAKSGSAIWESKGGAEDRVAFWNWYLSFAVPFAWNVENPINCNE